MIQFREVLRMNPQQPQALNNLGPRWKQRARWMAR
jgi:hypothetical protein